PRHRDFSIDSRGAAELGEVARKTIGNVHGGRSMRAQDLGYSVAWFRHEIAGLEPIACLPVEVPALSGGDIAPQQQAECRVADGASDHDAVTRFGTSAAQHLAMRDRAEGRDRNGDRSCRAIGITAQERATERLGVCSKSAREWCKPGI